MRSMMVMLWISTSAAKSPCRRTRRSPHEGRRETSSFTTPFYRYFEDIMSCDEEGIVKGSFENEYRRRSEFEMDVHIILHIAQLCQYTPGMQAILLLFRVILTQQQQTHPP